jgi:hypothetical protein
MAEQTDSKEQEDGDATITTVTYPPMTPEQPSTAASETSAMDTDPINGQSSPKHEQLEATASQNSLRRSADELDTEEHPAKRARKYSNADQESRPTVSIATRIRDSSIND